MYRSAINRIEVRNLFNKYDYNIDLDNNQDIAVIIAPNGCGKTTIFNFINFILNPTFSTFVRIRNVPFDSFTIVFENNKSIRLTKFKCDVADYIKEVNISIKDAQRETAGRILQVLNAGSSLAYNFRLLVETAAGKGDPDDIDFYDYLINKYAELRSHGLDVLSNESDDKELYELFARDYRDYSRIFPRFIYLFKSIKAKLESARLNIPTLFIEASRTQKLLAAEQPERLERGRTRNADIEPILVAKEKIDKLISEKLEEYDKNKSRASESLAMKFFKEYKQYNEKKIDYKSFAKAWTDYNKDIDQYVALGLLSVSDDDRIVFGTEEGTEEFKSGAEKYNSIGAFLNVLLYANLGNTDPLKEIYNKLELFKKIFDKRNEITNKKVLFTRNGLTVIDTTEGNNNATIPLQSLSSGEKNDFIMFYELIFNVSPHSIVLIDEPEISLHISWQEDYLDYLIDICTENNIQAIIATHSPNIINGHFDLIVEK